MDELLNNAKTDTAKNSENLASNVENADEAVNTSAGAETTRANTINNNVAIHNGKSLNKPVIDSTQPAANQSTDNTIRKATEGSEKDTSPDKLTKQEQARLHSLKAMLNASNARYKQVSMNRQPKFAAGLKIKILSGDHTGKIGVVLDADYIANRALISLSDQESPHWISFRSLGHADLGHAD